MLNVSTPIADFFSPTMAGCSPTQISFVNTTSDATIFNWDFGDGGSSTNIHPQHIYYIPGTYTITLISSNSFGCSDTMIKPAYISIPGTFTQFNISTLSGCQGQNIVFTDSSVNASNWNWDFGDGAIDSVQHPIHVYGDTGSYTVTLITRDSIGCTSSYVYPAPIIIHPTPVADASVTDPAGCSSFNTTFINLSSGATDYIWNFGDGDTSQSTAPGHTYLTGGQFFPDLIAITSFGCKDTFTFNTAIDVWQTPAAQISASDTVGCQPATITFNSTSTLTQNPSYFWLADNGTTSTSSVFQPVFINDSIYTISLVITNDNGCPDTANLQVTIHPTPVAGGSASSNTGCNPLVVQFTNSSTGGSTYNWLFGNGDSASTTDPIYNYTTAGIFNPAIIASNNFGCADTFQLNPGITVLQSPTPAFSSSSQQACYGDNIQLIDQSTNLISPAYLWNFGFGTSTLANPLINCTVPGIYDVSLMITNGNGCSDSIRQALYLEIFDTIAPVPDPIASASVVDDNTVIITWLNSAETDVASYRLYRQNSTAGTWDLIYTDTSPVLSTVSLTSSYTDTGLSAKTTSYSYKLQTTDQCGYTTALDSLTAHSTINLTATRNGVSIDLNWTPYLGCNFNEYRLYRTERPNGNAVMIASIPGTEIQYTDSTLTCPFEYEYRIEAIDLCGRGYNAWSDTSAAWPENIFENQHSEIIRTTVVNNKDVMTEWLPPVVQPNRVLEYQIFRSSDNINYSQVTTIPAGITTWTDTDVDINNNSYSYKVIVVNDCNISSIESNKGKSILLTGHWKDHRTYLQWSPYEEWSMGVEQYTIEFLSPQGVWVPINSVDGSTTSTQIDD